jgi:outer membrane protein TolC
MRVQIIVLPDVGLDDSRMVGHAIEDVRRRQPIALHLTKEVSGRHGDLLSAQRRLKCSGAGEGKARAGPVFSFENMLLAAYRREC